MLNPPSELSPTINLLPITYTPLYSITITKGMRGSRGGFGPPLEFAKLNIADITRNEEKIVIFHICALVSTVIRQTESIHKITIKN